MVRVMPLPLTVMLAVRLDGFVLAGAMTIIVPSFVPVEGDTVSQGASLLLTVQFVFEAMVITLCSPESFKFNEDCDSDRTGVAPACVMFMVSSGTFFMTLLTVMVAVRETRLVLTVEVTVIAPLFEPVNEDNVSQVALLLSIHFSFELMANVCDSIADEKFSDSFDTVSVT